MVDNSKVDTTYKPRHRSDEQLCILCTNYTENNKGICNLCKSAQNASTNDSTGDLDFRAQRQVSKDQVGPYVLMEIFGKALKIGREKGYEDGSWWDSKPEYTYTNLLTSASRHLTACETTKSFEYDEIDKNGNICSTKGNHAYQAFWNIALLAMRIHYNHTHLDDRKFIKDRK